jgi:hypothetical protein
MLFDILIVLLFNRKEIILCSSDIVCLIVELYTCTPEAVRKFLKKEQSNIPQINVF